ncbi:MAG: tetratricopeptide repeat protein [Saprospiraceae bacterium]|nr:tetratricopeptide repeat protein [Saprospiraceae bacterium]
MKKIIVFFLIISSLSYGQRASEFRDMAKEKIAQKDYQYALVLIEKAIALNDTNQWYYLTKSEIQIKLYGSREALKSINQAININNKRAEPYNRAGSCYLAVNIIDSAIIMYDLAIKYAENDTAKYSYIANRGSAKYRNRDFLEAIKDFEKVLEFNPQDIAALNNAANVYAELGKRDKSIECYKNIITIDENFIGSYINLGFNYSEMDSLDLSIEYFGKAIEMDSTQALIYSNRGYTYYKKGDYTNALKDINYSISLYPGNSYAYRNLALVYIATNKMDEACTVLGYALDYGFEKNYGNEVSELISKYCYILKDTIISSELNGLTEYNRSRCYDNLIKNNSGNKKTKAKSSFKLKIHIDSISFGTETIICNIDTLIKLKNETELIIVNEYIGFKFNIANAKEYNQLVYYYKWTIFKKVDDCMEMFSEHFYTKLNQKYFSSGFGCGTKGQDDYIFFYGKYELE